MSELSLGRQSCPIFAPINSLPYKHLTKNRAAQNIGGIATLSILPKDDVEGCYDFDTGPGPIFCRQIRMDNASENLS